MLYGCFRGQRRSGLQRRHGPSVLPLHFDTKRGSVIRSTCKTNSGLNKVRITHPMEWRMNHRQIETDILHLERIIGRISPEDRIPLSYWRNRIASVASSALVPAQQSRIQRIHDRLTQLETSN
jgi:hypothetical protein